MLEERLWNIEKGAQWPQNKPKTKIGYIYLKNKQLED